MNVRVPVAWDLDLAGLSSPVTVMEPYRCGISQRHWILQLKESQVLNCTKSHKVVDEKLIIGQHIKKCMPFMKPKIDYYVYKSPCYILSHLAPAHTLKDYNHLGCSLKNFTNILVEVAATIFRIKDSSVLKI
jgi:hypothetical protein